MCALSHIASAQFYSYKQLVKQADKAYEQAHFLKAMDYYQQAIDLNKDHSDEILFKMGDAAYQEHSLGISKNLLEAYLTKEEIPLANEAMFRLGRIAHLSGDYENAVRQYDLYLSEFEEVDSKITENINFLKSQAEWAQTAEVENEVDTIMRLSNDINSPYSENAPYMQDGQLYYSSLRFPIKGDKYLRNRSGMFKETEVVNIPNVSDEQLVSNPSFNNEGTEAYFTICDYVDIYSIHCKIHHATVDSLGQFSNVTKLPETINASGYTTTHPTLAETDNGTFLYFASNRLGGKGGMDIWKAQVSNNVYAAPQNQDGINTNSDDLSPYFHNKTNTLYFSSNGRNGYGGHDIYKLNPENNEATNLGDNVNSSYNDIHFFLSENGEKGYFTSNRPGSLYAEDKFETCCYDIYRAKVKECNVDLKTLAYDNDTKQPLADVRVKIYDSETGEVFYDQIPDSHELDVTLPCRDTWKLTASKDGYDDLEVDLSDMNMIYGKDNMDKRDLYLKKDLSDIKLTVSVFEEVAKNPLAGADLYLTDKTTMEQVSILDADGHISYFDIKADRTYMLEINKEGFKEKVVEFTSEYGDVDLSKEVILSYMDVVAKSIVSLEHAIPVTLYFDNDSPNPRTTSQTSTKTYTETFDDYYAKKESFRKSYTSLFNASDKFTASDEVENLFESHIKRGFDRYDTFKKQLLIVLQSGQDINIYLKGYTSPLAQSDYNEALGKRRVDSIRKEFDSWNNGALLQYIRSGQLVVTERSFGETTSPASVSDDPRHPSKSIFSPGASLERRVEIEEINFNEQ